MRGRFYGQSQPGQGKRRDRCIPIRLWPLAGRAKGLLCGMDLYSAMRAFCAVVDASSLSKAAVRLGISKSMVSRRVEQLEAYVGRALFHRSPGLMTVSEAGRDHYAECLEIVRRLDALPTLDRGPDTALSGRLTLQVLPGFAHGAFADALTDYCRLHPDMAFDITVSDALVDPVREGFDLVFQMYPAVNDMLIERVLFPHQGLFCASPKYLAEAPPLEKPQDLLLHRFARYSNYPWGDHWPFRKDDSQVDVELVPMLRTNSVQLLLQYVLGASGVAYLPAILATDHIRAGRLDVVLESYASPQLHMYAVYPPSHRNTAKVRSFLQFISARFAKERNWEIGQTGP